MAYPPDPPPPQDPPPGMPPGQPQPGPYPGMPPYPQPYPQSYPPQYGGYPGMPAYPTGYGMPVQPPSGGTAITAGVLAILGALWAIIAGIINVNALSGASGNPLVWVIYLQTVAFVIELLTLGPGSIMLLMRNATGRWLVAGGCVIHIIQGIIAVVALLSYVSSNVPGAFVGGGAIGALIVLAPAIATLVLVLVPLTGRWCDWRTRPGVGY